MSRNFPTLATFTRRMGEGVAGNARYSDGLAAQVTESNRTSLLEVGSNPVYPGQVVMYATNPVVTDQNGHATVKAVDGTFTAADFAGFIPYYELEDRVRDIQPLNTTSRADLLNRGGYRERDLLVRNVAITRWIETDLTTAPLPTDAVNVLPKANEGGIVSNAGGTPVAGLRFTGEFATDAVNGLNYVVVKIDVEPVI